MKEEGDFSYMNGEYEGQPGCKNKSHHPNQYQTSALVPDKALQRTVLTEVLISLPIKPTTHKMNQHTLFSSGSRSDLVGTCFFI